MHCILVSVYKMDQNMLNFAFISKWWVMSLMYKRNCNYLYTVVLHMIICIWWWLNQADTCYWIFNIYGICVLAMQSKIELWLFINTLKAFYFHLSILGIKMYNLGVHCHSAELIYEAKEVFSKFCWTCIQLGEQPASPEVWFFFLMFGTKCNI